MAGKGFIKKHLDIWELVKLQIQTTKEKQIQFILVFGFRKCLLMIEQHFSVLCRVLMFINVYVFVDEVTKYQVRREYRLKYKYKL